MNKKLAVHYRAFFSFSMIGILFSTTVLFSASAHCLDWQTYLEVESFSYSESTSVNSLLNKLNGSLSNGDLAFTHNRLELGVKADYTDHQFGLGRVMRYDHLVHYTQDTLQLFYLKNNDLPVDSNRDYNIFIETNRVRADGFTFSYGNRSIEHLQIDLKGSALQTSKLLDGGFSGQMTSKDGELSYGGLDLDYSYDEDIIFGHPVEEPTGSGVAFDLDIGWQYKPNLRADISIHDLCSKLDWDNAPHTIAQLNTDRVTFDENGFISVEPALSGRNSELSFSQRFPRRTSGSLSYISGNTRYWISDYHQLATHFSQLGFTHQSRYGSFKLGYYPAYLAYELGYESSWFVVNLKTSDFNFRNAKLVGLEMAFKHSW